MTPRPSRLRRWAVRLACALVIAYLVSGLMLAWAQNWLIFPGAFIHRGPSAQVSAAPGRELLILHTSDGHRVAAVFGKALEADSTPRPDCSLRPTVLFFYGNGDCIKTSLVIFDEFRRLGANVIVPEYVGYPMSGGKPSETGLYATADAAYQYLLSRSDVDPQQIVLVGRSLGGAAAIDLAARHRVAGLATISAFTTMDEMARKVMPVFPTGLVLKYHFDNRRKIGSVSCPVFIIHGTQDSLVPFAMMSQLAAAAHAPVIQLPVEGADHNDIFLVGGQPMLDEFGKFIESIHAAAARR